MVSQLKNINSHNFITEVREDDISLVHHCAISGNFEALKALSTLPYFGEVINDNSNEAGWTPLLSACAAQESRTDMRLVKLLVENGADVLKAKEDDGLAPIHFAASNNDLHLLDYIYNQVSDPAQVSNVVNHQGWTAAHFAAFLGRFDAMNFLIENGANLSMRSELGLTPIEKIILNDHHVLLEAMWPHAKQVKRDLNKKGTIGFIHIASAHASGSNTLRFLLEKCKISPNQLDNNHEQNTPLHYAVLNGKDANIKLLLRYGAALNAKNVDGDTPMHTAVSLGSLELVKLLERYGGDAMIKNAQGQSPIDMAFD